MSFKSSILGDMDFLSDSSIHLNVSLFLETTTPTAATLPETDAPVNAAL